MAANRIPQSLSFPFLSNHTWVSACKLLGYLRAQQKERMWPLPGPQSSNRRALNLKLKSKESLNISKIRSRSTWRGDVLEDVRNAAVKRVCFCSET